MSTALLHKRVRIVKADHNPLLVGQSGKVVRDVAFNDPSTYGLVCVLMDGEYMEWAAAEGCRAAAEANPLNTMPFDSRHAWVEPFELEVTSC